MSEAAFTQEQVADIVRGAVGDAVKALNPPDPEQRPGQSAKGANVNLHRHNPFPSLYRAMTGAYRHRYDDSSAYERDFTTAAKEALGYVGKDDDLSEGSIVWPMNARQAYDVLSLMGERAASKAMDRVDAAIKAMSEDITSVTVAGGTAGGYLVPPEFAQSLFAYALAPLVALRRVPSVRSYQATSNLVFFPRESVRAGASQAAEAGTLSSADATLAQQSVTVEKQYAFRRWSSELARDSQPAFSEFLSNTVIRDLAIQQDIQYLRGSGSTPQITGILNYSGLTTGPSLGTDGRTVKHDDFIEADYLLQAVDARGADFVISHPRTENTLRKEKDNEARYLVSADGRPTVAPYPIAGYLPNYKTTNLTITQTTGANTDTSTAIVGEGSQIYIVERQGIELAFSEHLYFNTDELAVRAIGRSTIVILQPASVLLVTGIRA